MFEYRTAAADAGPGFPQQAPSKRTITSNSVEPSSAFKVETLGRGGKPADDDDDDE